ncbi:alpha/beta hydrolase [Mycobacterium sp. M26]|uniref:alpha/beta hydrolase fold domain-containing protein n=1 Tax=Mycobacterium sp. M26 TaxID=1762962 RepID=UPI00073EBB7D|nr:alpha/beta hydrolase [Mycobacterium sp. M26]
MPSLPSRLVVAAIRITGRGDELSSATAAHRWIAERRLRPAPFGPPRRLGTDVDVSVGHEAGWPVYTVSPKGRTGRRRAVYVHGGGWVNEIDPAHWRFIAHLATASDTTVRVPIYPLIPWGTASEVVPKVADLVSAEITEAGAANVFLLGDSAGGQIALSASIWLRDNHSQQPGRVFLISPVVDATLNNPEIGRVQPHDPWLARPGVVVYAEQWRGELPIEDPRVSPLFAPLAGLTATTLFSGTRDILNPDARVLARKAREAGVDIDYVEGDGMVHVYPLLPIPEGRAARRRIVDEISAPRGEAGQPG